MTTLEKVEEMFGSKCDTYEEGCATCLVYKILEDRQAIATALLTALEERKVSVTIEDRVESAFGSMMEDKYNQALDQAQDIIRATLSNNT